MKTLPSCLCILGLAAGTALGGTGILMDQIGLDDGASIEPNFILACQYFEAGFSTYDVGVIDDFDNKNGVWVDETPSLDRPRYLHRLGDIKETSRPVV